MGATSTNDTRALRRSGRGGPAGLTMSGTRSASSYRCCPWPWARPQAPASSRSGRRWPIPLRGGPPCPQRGYPRQTNHDRRHDHTHREPAERLTLGVGAGSECTQPDEKADRRDGRPPTRDRRPGERRSVAGSDPKEEHLSREDGGAEPQDPEQEEPGSEMAPFRSAANHLHHGLDKKPESHAGGGTSPCGGQREGDSRFD